MKLYSSMVRNSLFIFAVMMALTGVRASAQSKADSAADWQASTVPARITQAIDETQLVPLKGNVHPLARAEFDHGVVADWQPMNRMLLLLQRGPEQEAALQNFMEEQRIKDSPNYHKWLTPQQFGAQFGPADADIQTVTDWLTKQGFQGIKVGAGRTTIEFSGTVGQVRNTFHAEIHRYLVKGETRQANSADPQIPAALTPVVAGIVSLHNFPRKSMKHDAGAFVRTADGVVKPLLTMTSGCGTSQSQPCYVLGPADFAKVYNIPAALDGTGVTIALVADSNINPQDITDFRNLFGLPANAPTIILNGPDPGLSPGPTGDEGEADLDVEVAGMVAPKATINLVVSESTFTAQGIDLSAEYIIDNNIAAVMSESFGNCESGLGSSGNAFYNGLWEQAAAQGITVMVSAGDGGSAGCDDFNTQSTATRGLAVSGFASTPFNVAVGGTDFDDIGTQTNFWNPSTGNAAGTRESALGYIHESTWNDSCAAMATSANLNAVCASANNIIGGSGGPSSVYAKPSWQSGGITPADSHRDVPDVSLFASDGPQSHSFYLVCQADGITAGSPPSCASSGPFSFFAVGGTSASSPAFAGIMALINQQQGGRQGNANPVLYKIAATPANSCNSSIQPLSPLAPCVFYDITKGNNSVPCAGASTTTCSSQTSGTNGVMVTASGSTTPAWTAGTGYDLATGLGSVNVTNLAAAWTTAVGSFKGTTSSLTINGSTTPPPIAHGSSVTVAATVTSTSGTPSGDVSLIAPTAVNGGVGAGTLASGKTSFTTATLPGGSYSVTAHYAGDGTFAPSDSMPVPVTVNKENSRLQIGIVTQDPTTGAITSTNATSFTYGSPYILRMDILNSSTNACQVLVAPIVNTGCALDATGTVTITDNGNPLDTGTLKINSEGSAEDRPIQLTGGAHTLVASYSGDISYNPPAASVTDVVTVSTAATATQIVPSVSSVAAGTPMTITATIASASNSSTGASGTVTFFNGGTQIGSPVAVAPTAASASVGAGGTAALTTSFSSTGTKTITASYSGDINYASSNAAAITVTVTSSGSFTVAYNPNPVVLSSTTGASATTTVTVTPSGGFTGLVTVTCPMAASLPPGVTCTAPAAITVTSGPATGTLTLSVTATSTTLSASAVPADRKLYVAGTIPLGGGKGWGGLSASAGLAAIILILLPGRKRYRASLTLSMVCVLSFTMGCGGGGGGGGTNPVATITKLTVPAPGRVASGGTFTFTATVTGGAPAGQVQLLDSGTGIGTAVTVATGMASLTSPALAVGTHAISAHYAGDANTLASSSGPINVTVTGNTTVTITTNPAATPAAAPVSVTIN